MIFKKIICAGLLACFFNPIFSQKFPEHPERDASETARNKGSAILLHLSFASQLPGGDLADRFGWNNALGLGLDFISKKNYVAGADAQFFFGEKVHDDVLAGIRTDSGYIIGNGRNLASVVLRERGFYGGAHVGKLFTFGGSARAGLRVTLGGGFLRHKIRVQDDSRSVNQLTGEYLKGYDRLTGGVALHQFIGFQMLGRSRSINYFIGVEFNEGFTRSLRDYDFAEMRKLEGSRFDFRYGIRAGWTLPFYFTKPAEIYY